MKLNKLMILTALSACGQGTVTVTKLVPGPTVEVPVEVEVPGPVVEVEVPGPEVIVEVPAAIPDPTEAELFIQDENEYRNSLGQLPLTLGLTCSLYDLRNSAVPVPPQPQPSLFPTALPSAKATFAFKGEFNQTSVVGAQGLDVLPVAIRSLYTNWYALRCSGYVLILDGGYHAFSTISDDASKLLINNQLVVDNDGHHGMQERTGSTQLRRGIHSIRLDYMAGSGASGLVLKLDGEVLKKNFYLDKIVD